MPDEEKVFQLYLFEIGDRLPSGYEAIKACVKDAIRKAQIFDEVYQQELENYLGLPTPKKRGF
jgi:hypothetical protein